jgi:hypothetical protein
VRAKASTALAGAAATLGVLLFVLLDRGQGGGDERQSASSSPPWRPPPACRVTVPNGSTPPGESPTPDRHGNGELWASLDRTGRYRVAPESAPEYLGPGGEIAVGGVLLPDGSVAIKAPWWRGPGVRGRLRLRARRLDAPAARVDRTVPPSGYGLTGFQAIALTLPATGCWKVTGSVGHAKLTFVTLVWRARPR